LGQYEKKKMKICSWVFFFTFECAQQPLHSSRCPLLFGLPPHSF
jgi:hypothetical protein